MSIPTIQGLAGITAEPDMRFTPAGKAVLSVRLAFSDRKYNDQTREWETSKTFYVDGTAWEQTAERLAEQLHKGDQVYVEGRIETQQWEKDGEKKSKPVLQLRTVRKLEKGGQTQGQRQGGFNGAQNVANGLGGQPVGGFGGNAGGGWGAPAEDPWGSPAGNGSAPF